jgi:uncharacterized protein (DUF302 family)/uncharacterized membrane protein YidH (DUF202 family)
MGFGFVVSRFGLFLQAMLGSRTDLTVQPYGLSFWFGTALIVAGVVVNLASARRHVELMRDLQRGEYSERPSGLAISVAFLLAVLGLAMAAYLVSIREPSEQEKSKQEKSMIQKSNNGIVTVESHHSVDETVNKLKQLLDAKGVKLFALIDHSGAAADVGMQMRPTRVLIFGSPMAGTPLMIASPTIAIDLPLKLLVWEDSGGKVSISFNDPAYLQERHGLPPELVHNIAAADTIAAEGAK